jgi:hypothetical protein
MCAHALWGCWQLSEDDTHTATLLAAGCMQVTADGLGSRADGVREVCAGLLGNLLRSVAARESALALEPPVLTSLIECIGGRHKALQEAAAGALLNLCALPAAAAALVGSGGIAAILHSAEARSRTTVELAIQLLTLVVRDDAADEQLYAAGGVPLLVSLLASKSEAVQVSFETRSPEPPSLSRVLVARTASRQVGCATLLGNIAMHEAYAARLAKDALAPLLQAVSATRSEALADAAVGVLRNLLLHADATFTTSKLPAHAFLPLLVSALESGRPQPIENATAALWKLSELPAHHMRIAGLGGIQLLAAAASDAETEPDALEAAVGALANLALSDALRSSVSDAALPLLTLITPRTFVGAREKLAGLAVNLSTADCAGRLLKSGALPLLTALLTDLAPAVATAATARDGLEDEAAAAAARACANAAGALQNMCGAAADPHCSTLVKAGALDALVAALRAAAAAEGRTDAPENLRTATARLGSSAAGALSQVGVQPLLVPVLLNANALPALRAWAESPAAAKRSTAVTKGLQRVIALLASALPPEPCSAAASAPADGAASDVERDARPRSVKKRPTWADAEDDGDLPVLGSFKKAL